MGRAGLLLVAVWLPLAGCRLIDAAGDDGCGTIQLLADDFEDGVTAADWRSYNDDGAQLQEEDGVLRVVYSGADVAWAGYATAQSHDIRGGSLSAEVAQVGGMTILEFFSGDTKVQTYAGDGILNATIMVGGDTISALETAYLPDEHVHWRMREDGGTVHWETSADGDSWIEIDARPTPLAVEEVTLLVSGGGAAGDLSAEFEAVEIAVADCAAGSL